MFIYFLFVINIIKIYNFPIFSNKLNTESEKIIENLKEQINKLNQSFKINESYINDTEFYDIVVDINSIISITDGWKIYFNKKGKDNYKNLTSEKYIKVGVIGNRNMGKSFLLSKLTGYDLPIGSSISTRGLSLKFPEVYESDRNFIIIDSAGMSTPIPAET